MNKIELGFFDDIEERLKLKRPGMLIKLIDVLKHYSNLPIQIDGDTVQLAGSGPRLRDKFTQATTYKSKYTKTINKLVVDGQLNITVVLTSNDNIELPEDARLINEYRVSQKKICLYGWKMELPQRSVKVWLIKVFKDTDKLPKENPVKTVVRNLRINLARIHAERETLRILLSNIMNGTLPLEAGSNEAKLVKTYVKKITAKLFAKKRNKLDQEDILRFALASEELVLPGSLESLNETAISFNDKYTKNAIKKMADELENSKVSTILYLTSSPKDKQLLDIQREIGMIKDKHISGLHRDRYKIEFEPSVKKTDLLSLLNRYKPTILHISLHASKVDGLYFEGPDHQPAPLSVKQFEDVIKIYNKNRSLTAIILSACNSINHAKAALPFCSYAMGTNAAIPDEASPLYAEGFYNILFSSAPPVYTFCHESAILRIQQADLESPDDRPIDQMFELLTNP
ncbi:hypothetical protein GCM10011500_09420 [Mucilaginibacter rubeus]|nr:hypothetical protein GCM10011500_09420 [Mucilaginibacter rubeus]